MLRKDVETTSKRVEEVRASSGLEQLEEEVTRLETAAADDSFWDDRTRAQQILMALNDVKDKIKLLTEIKTQVPTLFFGGEFNHSALLYILSYSIKNKHSFFAGEKQT